MFRTLGLLTLTFMLTGCGLWGNMDQKADVPASATVASASALTTLPMAPRTGLNGKVTYNAPDELIPMSLPRLIERYPNPSSQPKIVMGNESGSVIFTIDHTRAHTVSDMPTVRSSMSGVFRASYPDAVWQRDELANINGRTVAMFELEHGPANAREHVIICAFIFKDTMLIASFSVSGQDISRWLNTGRGMMNSITLHE